MSGRERWRLVVLLGAALVVAAAMIGLRIRLQQTDVEIVEGTEEAALDDTVTERSPTLAQAESPVAAVLVKGQVVDEHDIPVRGATVMWSDADNYPIARVGQFVRADDEGRFEIDRSDVTHFHISARSGSKVSDAQYYEASRVGEPVIIRVREGIPLEVTVVGDLDDRPIVGAVVIGSASETRTDARGIARTIAWESGALLQIRADGFVDAEVVFRPINPRRLTVWLRPGVTVTGLVLGPSGPIANAAVVGAPPATRQDSSFGTRTDAKGRWSLTLPNGRFAISATARGWVADGARQIDTAHVQDVILRVKRGFELSGTVVALDGAAVVGARVTAYPLDPMQRIEETTTNADGMFFLYTPRGRWKVVATEGSTMAMAMGGVGMTMVMEPSPVIRGIVVDDANAPMRDVSVRVWAMPGITESGRTDDNGEFEIPFPKLTYDIVVRDGEGGEANTQRAKPGVEHRFVIERPTTVTGRVLLDGQPVTDYYIADQGPLGNQRDEHVQDTDGRFTIRVRGTGDRKLALASSNTEPRVVTINVSPGERVDAGVIELVTARRVTGRVFHRGRAVPAARVSASSHTRLRMPFTTATDDDGSFSLALPTTRPPSRILVWHPRFDHAYVDVGSNRDDVVVNLERLVFGTVRGRAPRGSSLEFATPGMAGNSPRFATDELGHYEISLPPGDYEMIVWTESTNDDDIIVVSALETTMKVTVRANETVTLDYP